MPVLYPPDPSMAPIDRCPRQLTKIIFFSDSARLAALGLFFFPFKVLNFMFLGLIISKFGVENGHDHFFDQN